MPPKGAATTSQQKKHSETAEKLDKFRRTAPTEDLPSTSQTAAPEDPAGEPQSDTQKVLLAIHQCQSTLTSRIDELKVDISLIRQDAQRTRERVTEVEQRVGSLDDKVTPLEAQLSAAQSRLDNVYQRIEDQENRLRRCNLRFVGLPERAEGRDPQNFLESLLTSTFGRDSFSAMFAVERAHRIPTRPLPPGAPPRTFIAKFLNYRDRDTLLRLTREKGPIPFEDARIHVYPDFSVEVQRKRALFSSVKRRLKDLDLNYAMFYPSRLKVIADNRTHFFESPREVQDWLESRRPECPADRQEN